MACNWLIRTSSHCPNLVRIGCNAKILSRFKVYGVMHDPIGIAFDAKVVHLRVPFNQKYIYNSVFVWIFIPIETFKNNQL